jgi:PAS domain S-box-containing protein
MWRRFSIRAVPIVNDDGTIREWVGVHHDITDVRETETRFRQLAENVRVVFYVHEIDEQRVSYVNPEYERVWRQPPGAVYADLRAFMRDIHTDDLPMIEAAMQRQLAGQNTEVRYRLVRADGSVCHIHDRAFLTTNPETGARRLVGVAEDVTVTTEARLQLTRNAETFEAMVRGNPFGVYVVDSRFRLLQISEGAKSVFAGIEPLIGRDFGEILRIVWHEPFASEAIHHFQATLATGEPYISPNTIEPRHNIASTEAYDWRIDRIVLPDGSFGVVCYFYDLSERMALEASLQEALRDKDLLLQEINHRVRNSMSIVASLLSLQGRRSNAEDLRQSLSEAASRIQAVARVHERLYKGPQIDVVEFGTYLKDICKDLLALVQDRQMTLVVKAVPVDLAVDQAVHLGLIVNELVTNAFKHSGERAATIKIDLTQEGESLTLTVADDGVGMPDDYSASSNSGLGMQVIRTLTRQLGGSLVLPLAGGTATFSVILPFDTPRRRSLPS